MRDDFVARETGGSSQRVKWPEDPWWPEDRLKTVLTMDDQRRSTGSAQWQSLRISTSADGKVVGPSVLPAVSLIDHNVVKSKTV